MNVRMAGRGGLAAIIVGLVTLAGAAPVAMAQPGGGGGGGFRQAMAPAVNSRSLDKYAKMLDMTDDQKEAARTLFEGYQDQANHSREKLQAQMDDVRQKFRDTRDPSVWQSMGDTMTKFREDRKKADAAFFDDVKSVLTPSQIEKWPEVERANRRETVMRRGFISGERVNLFDVVDQMKFSPETMTQVTPILKEYDEQLDRALIAREAITEEGFTKFQQLRASGDMKAMQDFMDKGREVANRVKETNKKFARSIADVIPEDQQAAFNTEVQKRTFPDVYRDTAADREIAAASGFADLTADQKEKLQSLKDNYTRSLTPLQQKMASTQEETEQKITAAEMMARFRGGQDGPMGDLRRERRELVSKTQDDLKKILSPEQADRLPVGDEGGDGPPGGDQPGRRARQRPDT
ncbi:MAG: hypothetical protein WC718_03295 [Phycisphaerales bacterium]|jgi:hypothetical protein